MTSSQPTHRPSHHLEASLHADGYSAVAGLDEAGRGPLAGPVSAGVAVLPARPTGDWVRLIDDSKKLTSQQREAAYTRLKTEAVAIGVGYSSPREIDSMGIASATRLAMKRALEQIPVRPDYLLLDAFPLPGVNLPQRALIKGDSKVLSIAAASIAAKVERDHLMDKLDARYPRYGFASNKGYGTPDHLRAIAEHGPCDVHRLTFGRVREAVAKDQDKHRSSIVGRHAETVAAGHLKFLGYEVLETNYRTRLGEVDIVALQGGTLVFCEVRARRPSVYGTAEESITPTKRARLVAAAQDYLQAAEGRWKDWRMDLVAITLDRTGNVKRIRIVENAIEE